jgi:hypothetical protein
MADAMKAARNKGIPALPPLQPVAPVIHMPDEGDGQNKPSASDVSAIGASTTPTPPQRILVQADSAVSRVAYRVGIFRYRRKTQSVFSVS